MGYVYFISNQYSIKIGYTKNNPKKRLKQLQTGSSERLYLLGYVKGDLEKEKTLHKKFAQFKLRNNGEWFSADDELIEYINLVNEMPDVTVIKNDLWNNIVMTVPKIKIV